jgi:hypothetical protein
MYASTNSPLRVSGAGAGAGAGKGRSSDTARMTRAHAHVGVLLGDISAEASDGGGGGGGIEEGGRWHICGMSVWSLTILVAVAVTVSIATVFVLRSSATFDSTGHLYDVVRVGGVGVGGGGGGGGGGGDNANHRRQHASSTRNQYGWTDDTPGSRARDPGDESPPSSHARPPGARANDYGVRGHRVAFRVSESGVQREAHAGVVAGVNDVTDLFTYSTSCRTPGGTLTPVRVFASTGEAEAAAAAEALQQTPPSAPGADDPSSASGRLRAFVTMQFNRAEGEGGGLFVLFYEGRNVPPGSHCAFACMTTASDETATSAGVEDT